MISGRGLGHTGGTLDKLDSIPGYVTQPDLDLFRKVTREAGCAIIGQTADLAPADKRLYGIRDVTATVESIPLITASILSKKLAAGLEHLVLDVKMGSGAFMATMDEAVGLAESLVAVANGAGLRTTALITDMDEAAGALRGQCAGSGPCRGIPARPPGGAARHGDHAGARRRTADERRDRPRCRSGHVTPAPHLEQRRGGRALRPHGGTAGRAQGFPRPSRSPSAAGTAGAARLRGRGRSGLGHPHPRSRPRRHRTGRRAARCRRPHRPSRRAFGTARQGRHRGSRNAALPRSCRRRRKLREGIGAL